MKDNQDNPYRCASGGDCTGDCKKAHLHRKALSSTRSLDGIFNACGKIDDVRIYDVALSAGEIKELYGQAPSGGLVGHWKFDEGEGSIACASGGDCTGDCKKAHLHRIRLKGTGENFNLCPSAYKPGDKRESRQ